MTGNFCLSVRSDRLNGNGEKGFLLQSEKEEGEEFNEEATGSGGSSAVGRLRRLC